MFANCMTQFSLHIYPNMTKCSDGERSLHNQPFPRNVKKKFKSEKAMLLKLIRVYYVLVLPSMSHQH